MKKTIRKHINNIFVDKESEYFNNTQKMRVVGVKQSIHVYNLNVIISVGYRVKSNRGTLFRKWANKILKEYLLKGYVINDERTLITNDNYARLINKEFELEVNVSPKEETIWLTQ